MEENKNLTDAQLEEVGGGASTTTRATYYCADCGSKLRSMLNTAGTMQFRCMKCNVIVPLAKAVKRVTTLTIDGDVHTTQGEF